jgi:hypothetical protein
VERLFVGGHQSFFYKGINSRWRDVLTEADVGLYEGRIKAELTPGLIRWLALGRLAAVDPVTSPD